MNTSERNKIIDSFLAREFPNTEYKRSPLAGDASFRKYERVKVKDKSFVLMDCLPADKSLNPFINMAEFLVNNGLSAPQIFAKNVNNGLLLLEDLGDLSFNKAIKSGHDEQELYKYAVDVLIALRDMQKPNIPKHSGRQQEEIMRLIEWYLPLRGISLPKKNVDEYRDIWDNLFSEVGEGSNICLYDYHADNLMWIEKQKGLKKVGLLDFQDAVIGSSAIDLAALLQDIRRDVSKKIQKEMFDYFVTKTSLDKNNFSKEYSIWGAHWNVRIVGTFARLMKRDNKPRYLDYLPAVWNRVEQNLEHPSLKHLKNWLDKNIPEENRHAA